MTCPSCGMGESRVIRTAKGAQTYRIRQCECGAGWSTVETVERRSIKVMQGVPRIPIAPEVIAFVLSRDGNRCRYCGCGGPLGIDHVVPLCAAVPRGTSIADETNARNAPGNLAACCRRCNSAKGDRVDGKRHGERYSAIPIAANSSPVAVNSNKPAPGDLGGLGLGLSDLSYPSFLRADPDLTSVVSKQGSARKGRGDATEYAADFEAIWHGCTPLPRGSKFKAFKAWERLKPSSTLVLSVFAKWRTTDGWRRGFEPHMSTWLNDRGWENEPTPAEVRGTSAPTKVETSKTAILTWHQGAAK